MTALIRDPSAKLLSSLIERILEQTAHRDRDLLGRTRFKVLIGRSMLL